MRKFNLKGEWLAEHPYNRDDAPGRTIHPEGLRLSEPNWKGSNHAPGEHVVRRESQVEDEELRAAREWLWHVEAGRIGGSTERSDAD